MENNEVLRSLEKLIRRPAGSLDGSEALRTLDGWDSLAMIEFIAMVDEQHGIELDAEQVRTCQTVEALIEMAESRTVNR